MSKEEKWHFEDKDKKQKKNQKKKQKNAENKEAKRIEEIERLKQEANAYYDQQDYKRSESSWRNLLALCSSKPQLRANALFMQANCLSKFDPQHPQIAEYYYAAYKLNPGEDIYYKKLMKYLIINKNYQQAYTICMAELAPPSGEEGLSLHRAITLTAFAELIQKKWLEVSSPTMESNYLLFIAARVYIPAKLLLIENLLKDDHFQVAKSYVETLEEDQLLIDQGDKLKFYGLMVLFYCHHDNPLRNPNKIIPFLKEAPQSAHINHMLAQLYNGEGEPEVKKNAKLALICYRLAAEKLPAAACDLAYKYLYGEDVEQDEKEAFRLYTIAVDQGYVPAYTIYSFLLLKRDPIKKLAKVLKLLTIAKESSHHAKLFYIQLKLFRFKYENGALVGKLLPQDKQMPLTEAKQLYTDLFLMAGEENSDNAYIQFLAGHIALISNNIDLVIDHFRASAEYGSLQAHDSLFAIFISRILKPTSRAQRELDIKTLRNIGDSKKFFTGDEHPLWLSPVFSEKKLVAEIGDIGYVSNIPFDAPDLTSISDIKSSSYDEFIGLMNDLQYKNKTAVQSAEVVSRLGKLANKLIIDFGVKYATLLNSKLLILLQIVRKKSETETFSNWSLMRIFKGVASFQMYSESPRLNALLQWLFGEIISHLPIFDSWKLVMLLEATKDICYLQPGIRDFIKKILKYTLDHWSKMYTELDGSILLCYLIGFIDKHYHVFLGNDPLKLKYEAIIIEILGADISSYESRPKVMYECYLGCLYYLKMYSTDLAPKIIELMRTLKLNLEATPHLNPKITFFQSRVSGYTIDRFSSSREAKCINPKEEGIVGVQSVDLVMKFKPLKKSEDSKSILTVAVEADGPGHFYIIISKEGIISLLYTIKTFFSKWALEVQGAKNLRVRFDVWQSSSDKECYDLLQSKFGKIGLTFPPYLPPRQRADDSFSWRSNIPPLHQQQRFIGGGRGRQTHSSAVNKELKYNGLSNS